MSSDDNSRECEFCKLKFPIDRTSCPHCSQPLLFPNVSLAEKEDEVEKLEKKYVTVVEFCKKNGLSTIFQQFEEACKNSVAVLRCEPNRMFKQIASGTDIFSTYHDLESLRLRLERSTPHDWEKLRPQAEIELLGTSKHLDQLHYACISLDGKGVKSYGRCNIELKESMIQHRASCFEGNSALIYEHLHNFSSILRSPWGTRSKLCVSKIGLNFSNSTVIGDFPSLICRQNTSTVEDNSEFVEVQVFGTITSHTFQQVEVSLSELNHDEKILWKAVEEKLKIAKVNTIVI